LRQAGLKQDLNLVFTGMTAAKKSADFQIDKSLPIQRQFTRMWGNDKIVIINASFPL
jgi:hypothetical protein